MVDIHEYQKQLERQLAKLDEEGILPENKEIILKFKNHLLSENIGIPKIGRYILDLRKFSKMLNKPYSEANKEDIRRIVSELNLTSLSEESKKTFKIMLRKLYRFIRGIDEEGIYPDEVKWISIRIPRSKVKIPEELLTETEIKEMLRYCKNIRDRALISCLAESGSRIGEIAGMQIKHISFEQYGARLTIQGKTGMRKVLVINSVPYLLEWINQHPCSDNPESFLWYNQQTNKFLKYTRIVNIIKSAAKRAGIKKRVHCHLFRHSRATQLANIMSEAQMKQYLGWEQSSRMAGIYVHMSGKDTDDALLRANGIISNKDKEESKLKPIKCMKCHNENPVTNKYCYICGFILNEEQSKEVLKNDFERKNMDDLLDRLVQDKDVLSYLLTKIKEVKTI